MCQIQISAAKRCIRENRMNLTYNAASLGYTSIYYYSKQFKKITGMSPSQYQKMVRISKKDPLYEQREL
ncbi:helix-turn-helix transcriptional regulator [Anaerobutyricum hallii]|nr:helix-turn-helix transcriptional regulator [Anaerobutyricum hallii]